jgi:hypothetical protein
MQAQLDADEEDVEAELFGSDDEPAAPVSAADAAAERKRTLQELAKKAAAVGGICGGPAQPGCTT